MSGPQPNSFPPLPGFPPGVDPETWRVDSVNGLLKSAAYFSIFSVADTSHPNSPELLIPGLPFTIVSVAVNEMLHRFDISLATAKGPTGLRAANRVGEHVAEVGIRWTPIPDDFEAAPEATPPKTLLNPFCSQRFSMLDGHLSFRDADGSGFRAFGTGRTFPAVEGGRNVLRIGAVIDVLEGMGRFRGLPGTVCVNGYIEPPNRLALSLIIRFMDPERRLLTDAALTPLEVIPNPDPGAVFMTFLGETDADRPVRLRMGPDGNILGAEVYERLRLAHVGFDLNGPHGLRSSVYEGPLVGSLTAKLHFNPLDPRPISPISTTEGELRFVDLAGNAIGSVFSNMVEGRAIRTPLEGAPMPVFRLGGFGPLLGGTGFFEGADGMLSMNAAVSVMPRTLSNLYILRLADPDGRFRARLDETWIH